MGLVWPDWLGEAESEPEPYWPRASGEQTRRLPINVGESCGDSSCSSRSSGPKSYPSSLTQYVEGFDSRWRSREPAFSSTDFSHARCVFRACLRTPAFRREKGRGVHEQSLVNAAGDKSGAACLVQDEAGAARNGHVEMRSALRRAKKRAGRVAEGDCRGGGKCAKIGVVRVCRGSWRLWRARTVGGGIALAAAGEAAAVARHRLRLLHR